MGQYITSCVNILPDGSIYYHTMGQYITRWVNHITRWVNILPDGSIYYQMGQNITRLVNILPDGSIY